MGPVGGVLCACAATIAAVGGCTAASSSSVTATGNTLTIYASAPAGAGGQQAQDVLDAEQLALSQAGNKIGSFTIRFETLRGAKVSDNARKAIEDKAAIAYLGEVKPGASEDSLGITNAQDLLQVSPTDTALEETQSTTAVPGSPGRYYEALKVYGRTFARVVPNAGREAKATVQEMQSLGVKTLYVADDGSEYGKAIALAVRKDAATGITIVPSAGSADAAFFGGSDVAVASRVLAGVGSNVKLFAPSALADPTAAAQLGQLTRNVYISTPGTLARNLPAGPKFVSDFRAHYGHDPSWRAIFGYAAMTGVLDALHKAGSAANNRATVIHDFFSTHSNSVLGQYTIGASGDTDQSSFGFSRLKGQQLVPVPG